MSSPLTRSDSVDVVIISSSGSVGSVTGILTQGSCVSVNGPPSVVLLSSLFDWPPLPDELLSELLIDSESLPPLVVEPDSSEPKPPELSLDVLLLSEVFPEELTRVPLPMPSVWEPLLDSNVDVESVLSDVEPAPLEAPASGEESPVAVSCTSVVVVSGGKLAVCSALLAPDDCWPLTDPNPLTPLLAPLEGDQPCPLS